MALPQPTAEVGVMLASAIVHAQEALSPEGHDFDRTAFYAALASPDVQAYMEQLRSLALLPLKRVG